jgi:hypothetical protein
MMRCKIGDASDGLLKANFFSIFVNCADSQSPEMIGYFFATTLLMIEASADSEENAQRLWACLGSVEGLNEQIAAFISEELADMEFLVEDPLDKEEMRVPLGQLAQSVIAFLQAW